MKYISHISTRRGIQFTFSFRSHGKQSKGHFPYPHEPLRGDGGHGDGDHDGDHGDGGHGGCVAAGDAQSHHKFHKLPIPYITVL